MKMTNFPDILYKYLNSKVDTGLVNIGDDFLQWISQSNLTDAMKKKITDYVNSNRDGFDSLWKVVVEIMSVKDEIINQIDNQGSEIKSYIGNEPGGEGYVFSHPEGDIKYVSRSKFSAANRAAHKQPIDEGERANAAFEYAVALGLLKARTEDEEIELRELKTKLSELETQMDQEEDEERYDELSSEFDEVQERVDELDGEYTDVYDLIPYGGHYELDSFMSASEGFVISVGTASEADESMRDYYQEWVDDPVSYLNSDTISYHLDGDKVADEFESIVDDWVLNIICVNVVKCRVQYKLNIS